MIQEILKSLALENRRLIIPTIGAFLVKEIDNSQKRIIFSSFLKYDDGLLTKLLCKQKNISEEQAKQIIEKFVHEVLDVINNGNNFHIADFGYFTKDKQGVIDFVVENSDDAKNEEIITEEKKEEEPIFPSYVPPVVETPVLGDFGEQKNDFDFSNLFVPPVNNTTNTSTGTTKIKEKKNNTGYWILTILLIIIAVLLLLYIFSKEFKQTVNSLLGSKPKIEVEKDTPTIVVDTVKVQQEDTVAIKQEQIPEQTALTPVSTPNGKYQVIAGCYIERSIAENFANELTDKGYNVRIPETTAGEWNIVIIYESNDADDATRVKDDFAAAGYEDAYVRTRPGPIVTTTSEQNSSYSNTANTTNTISTPNKRGKYQAIAGCYLYRENAERFAEEIRNKGFDVRIPDNLMGEWNILIVCESDDFDEVNKVKEQCIAAGYDAWIRTR